MNKKDLIKKHAIEIIAVEGFHNTKMQDIADKAGIAVGTIYNHFKSKQEIFDYIFFVIYDQKLKYLDELEKMDITPLNRIRLYIRFHIEQWEKNPDVFKILIQDGIPFSKQSINIRDIYNKLISKLKSITEEGQEIGEIVEIDPSMIAYLILNLMKIIQFRVNHKSDYEIRKNQISSFIIDGLKK